MMLSWPLGPLSHGNDSTAWALYNGTFCPTFGVFGFPFKSMLKLQELRAHAEMEFVWSNIYCESSRLKMLQTLVDNELLMYKN